MKPIVPEPDDPISDEEVREAEALRRALEGAGAHAPDGGVQGAIELLGSLRAAHAPSEIDPAAHRAIVARALAKRPARTGAKVIRISFGITATFAAAAAVFFVLRAPRHDDSAALPFASRSTQELFDAPFVVGGTTARVDRIAEARAAEFRDNQFARWGLR
ncbi:MAG: hypothetical protein U0235_32090 [Polyangiaceae bacterium]